MPGFGAAVAGADDNMNVQGGLALRIIGDVADERSDLDLLANRNLLVVFLLPIKIEQNRIAERPNRGETRRMDIFASSEFLKTCRDFLASFEHDDKGALPAGLMKQFMLHDSLRWRTNG